MTDRTLQLLPPIVIALFLMGFTITSWVRETILSDLADAQENLSHGVSQLEIEIGYGG
ncbi:hypothetical protein [Ponticaulis sp.]|uniref:hypothetical protein n=1 Tax=Ponticaulis sp. TaxID=2020902 RepID=UPI0025F3AD25|nr:hypothetical protein [Ponticaulis sp.]|tara:strand:- start:71955 stop:72128 length:174 start_codon:yes stop_codon:yes gene_type:complete